jgi:hypothetical protein
MKKIMLTIVACIATALVLKAQCDKSFKWNSSKSEFLDTSGNFQHSNTEDVEVTTTPKNITIKRGAGGDQVMSGDIDHYACNWKNKTNGKTSFQSVLVEPNGKTRHAMITIEAVNGKTTILLEAKEEDTKIRLNVDSFEEVQ